MHSLLATSARTLATPSLVRVSRRPRTKKTRPARTICAQRVVVKLGTRVLVDASGGPRLDRLESLARSVARLRAEGREVIVISSGAVGLGSGLLGFDTPPSEFGLRRACAAVGQARLLSLYQSAFAIHGLMTAQVLLTCDDFGAGRRDGLRTTFERLLDSGVVPVVNENDAVSLGSGLGSLFRDNDGLAAHVAAGCGADLLLLLTDVDGVCARDPRRFPGEPTLDHVNDAEALLADLCRDAEAHPPTGLSRGGMHSKVASAVLASRGTCDVVIASGDGHDVVEQLVAGMAVGTFFPRMTATHTALQLETT